MPAATDAAAPDRTPGRGRISVRALLLLAAVAVGVYGIDQGSKYLITQNLELGDLVPVLGEVLQLHYVTNSGAAFSLASGFTWILSIVAVARHRVHRGLRPAHPVARLGDHVRAGARRRARQRHRPAVPRARRSARATSIDFIQVWGFPAIFNGADIAVVSSMGLFILLSLRGVGLDGTRTPMVKTTAEAASPTDEKA